MQTPTADCVEAERPAVELRWSPRPPRRGAVGRGCLALLAGLAMEGGLCAVRAHQRRVWGAEAVIALYALLLCMALLVLLATMTLNLARGVTAFEVRQRRRQGKPLPSPSCTTLVHALRATCCDS